MIPFNRKIKRKLFEADEFFLNVFGFLSFGYRIRVKVLVHMVLSHQGMEFHWLLLLYNQMINFLVEMNSHLRFVSFFFFPPPVCLFLFFLSMNNWRQSSFPLPIFFLIWIYVRWGNNTQSRNKEKDGQKKNIKSSLRL